jgi:hypothetical protein
VFISGQLCFGATSLGLFEVVSFDWYSTTTHSDEITYVVFDLVQDSKDIYTYAVLS